MRFGDCLVALLERHGVRHVSGIPGMHTAELYRGLAGGAIRHITPRHEQGAAFTPGEFGSAMDARTPIIVLVWNNCGYGEAIIMG